MIVGSVYLGKKARKAYKKRQAEKAAKQLVGGIVVADPSDELILNAPPVSPIEMIASPTSLCSSTGPPSADSTRSYPNGVKLAAASPTTYSSGGLRSVPTECVDEYAQYEQRDLSNIEPEQPPSYDVALYSPKAEDVQSLGHILNVTAGHLRDDNAQGTSSDDCPTCLRLLQQRHLHQQHYPHHTTQTASSGDTHSSRRQTTYSQSARPSQAPVVAELPAESLGTQMAELSDTSPLVELPAEIPAEMLQKRDEQPLEKASQDNERAGADGLPVELSADLNMDLMRSGVKSKAELQGDMPNSSQGMVY